ncbi:hypothetical protein Bca4012_057251 [Brassica carinata]
MMGDEAARTGPQNRELYALLNLSPEASDEEIRKAYRQWAQVYHPDKSPSPLMKEVAEENFKRICEAYEILSDETKRLIYDLYGMEGLTSGLELGPRLSKAEEIKEERQRIKRREEEAKKMAHFMPTGSIVFNLPMPSFLDGDSIMRGNFSLFLFNVFLVESMEWFLVRLSIHSTATLNISKSLSDGSINLTNTWVKVKAIKEILTIMNTSRLSICDKCLSNFYMIGWNGNGVYKVLKIDRLHASELNLSEDSTAYTKKECYELLKRIHEASKATCGLKLATLCYVIIGFIKFMGPYYMLVITERREIGEICGHKVYEVSNSEIISLRNSSVLCNIANSRDENRQVFLKLDRILNSLLLVGALAIMLEAVGTEELAFPKKSIAPTSNSLFVIDDRDIIPLFCAGDAVIMQFMNGTGKHVGIRVDYSTAAWLSTERSNQFIVQAYIKGPEHVDQPERSNQFIVQAYIKGPEHVDLEASSCPLWLKFDQALSSMKNPRGFKMGVPSRRTRGGRAMKPTQKF